MEIILIGETLIIVILILLLYRSRKFNKQEGERFHEQIKQYNSELETRIQQRVIKVEQDLESRTALLRDVSHELRSPLHGIISLSEILSTQWEEVDEGKRKKYIASIFEASTGLTVLVNDLLDFSKFEAGKMVFNFKELNLSNAIMEVIDYCRKLYLFDKKIHINFESKKITEASIYGDKDRIKQLIINLFVNAIKYTEEGVITTKLTLVNYNGKHCWQFSISDQGPGIPEEELSSIFEPFKQSAVSSSKKKIGTGIGLTMCKQIIEGHSGEIWAENNLEKGAKFYFVIPILKKKRFTEDKKFNK